MNPETARMGESRFMVELSPPQEQLIYEIRVRGEIPDLLRVRHPLIETVTCRTETVLYRDVSDPAELDLLLEQVQSWGLVLCSLRASPLPADLLAPPRSSTTMTPSPVPSPALQGERAAGPRSCELSVEGVLGPALLRSMRWSHRVLPAGSVARINGEDVSGFLASCSDYGLVVEQVTRRA
ncbi:MAG: hypothetical protein L0H41_06615 [Microlunatus sp.]|nr:hypothetical protein [Microlunatus sp.]